MILFRLFLIGFFLLTLSFTTTAQEQYRVGLIGFYNLENLFDTLDAPDVRDSEFTPLGSKHYGSKIYREKLQHLSRVVSEMGADLSPDGLAILGVSEIENRSVLADFVKEPSVEARNYQIIHYDSPDERGIDVGMLYNPKYFTPTASRPLEVVLYESNDTTRDYTRDVLYVTGLFDGEPIHVFVNHWPSRSGGEAASRPKRAAAAMVVKLMTDSLMAADPNSKIVIMGDLNDDPVSPSVAEVLGAQGKEKQVRAKGLFNPMYEYYRQGIGSNAYRDSWNLFDQVIVSQPLLAQRQEGYHFYKAVVFRPAYLFQQTGAYKGYPFRTFVGDSYLGGYSDHLPVYVALIKPVDTKK